jgi:hypothetical protein
MIPSCRLGLIGLCCFIAFDSAMVAAEPERSVSTSRQFVVYGPELRLRGAICDLAEQTKRDLLQLIDQRGEWTTPIVINVRYPQANLPEAPRAALNFSQTGFGLKLQLDLIVAAGVTHPQLRREILRTILLERMYRGHPDVPAGTTYVSPPDWLLDGVPAQQADSGSSAAVDILAAPVSAKKILSLADFLRQRSDVLDAPGRSLYRAYSMALVEFLLHGPEGRHRLARFISDLPSASNDPMTDLRLHFPELFDANGSAEKEWTAFVAQLATSQGCQLFGAEETERALDELLLLRITNAGSEKRYSFDEFANFIRMASAKPALVALSRELSILSARANPIYQPIILEYAEIASLLARGKTKRIAERLAGVKLARRSVALQRQRIDDYMNWFEATKSRGPSGAFDDYMRAAELATQREQTRRDPISLYLDALETQFQN